MKRLKQFGGCLLVLFGLMAPFAVMDAMSEQAGSAGDFRAMEVFGIMTCEWTDGHQALMVSKNGDRRFYNMEKQRVEVGVTYRFKRGPGAKMLAGLPYLVPVNEQH